MRRLDFPDLLIPVIATILSLAFDSILEKSTSLS